MPPAPTGARISYRPSLIPADNVIACPDPDPSCAPHDYPTLGGASKRGLRLAPSLLKGCFSFQPGQSTGAGCQGEASLRAEPSGPGKSVDRSAGRNRFPRGFRCLPRTVRWDAPLLRSGRGIGAQRRWSVPSSDRLDAQHSKSYLPMPHVHFFKICSLGLDLSIGHYAERRLLRERPSVLCGIDT